MQAREIKTIGAWAKYLMQLQLPKSCGCQKGLLQQGIGPVSQGPRFRLRRRCYLARFRPALNVPIDTPMSTMMTRTATPVRWQRAQFHGRSEPVGGPRCPQGPSVSERVFYAERALEPALHCQYRRSENTSSAQCPQTVPQIRECTKLQE